ncbi:MAG: serine hydroxymethyltransferase [Chloroflexi bacterium]|nr:serine hydroxymethyltransferase [Chloroflexota bacterium]
MFSRVSSKTGKECGTANGLLGRFDPEIEKAIQSERDRQRDSIILIAAENYASKAVMEAQGSVLTNKYAEGYPDRRYYAGCANVDIVERLAIERAKQLFHAEHANVQPHAGSQANMAAYLALVEPGDTIMAMSLSHGGHLTHGSPVNFSGKVYRFVSYGVSRQTEQIDFDEVEKLSREARPKLIVAGASAYPLVLDWRRFRKIADGAGARLMVDMAHQAGLIAAGVYPSPVQHAHIVTSTTHKTMRGPRGGFILCKSEFAGAIDSAVFPGMQGGPFMHAIAAKAVCFLEAMQPGFAEYQRSILENAATLANELKQRGLRLVAGGTQSHLALVDLSQTGVTGRQAERALEEVGIIVNRNAIPFDRQPPTIASGIRVGTPAVTTRGFGAGEMREIARMITTVVSNTEDSDVKARVRQEVLSMCRRFPVPGIEC